MCFSRSAIRAPNARRKLLLRSVNARVGPRTFPAGPRDQSFASALRRLPSRMPQCGFEAFLFLVPPGIFGLRFFLESLHLDLDSSGSLRVLLLGGFQRCLRLIYGSLASFTLPLTSSLLARPFPLAPFMLFFESESGLSVNLLVDREGRRLLRFTAFRLAGCFRRSFGAAQIGG